MKPFCEVIVQSVLPTVRALIAKDLIEKHGFTQKATAEKLGVRQPAISQYRRELRGKARIIEKDKSVTQEIEKLSNRIASGELTAAKATTEFCNVCKIIRTKKIICNLCSLQEEDLKGCNICIEQSPC